MFYCMELVEEKSKSIIKGSRGEGVYDVAFEGSSRMLEEDIVRHLRI